MGTNFYVRGHSHSWDPEYHIGKRSAAGFYCWNCGITLCKGGINGVHKGVSGWHDACPKCHEKWIKEELTESSAGRELGFNKSTPQAKLGVKSCSSWTWAMHPEYFKGKFSNHKADSCPTCQRPYEDVDKVIEDEYGRLFTYEEFLQMLEECPIKFEEMIGQQFS